MSNKGTLTQLVSLGPSSVYLVSDPEITFFKTVYKRHTNFAMETITQNFTRIPKFNRRFRIKISKLGDLMYQNILVSDIPEVKPSRSYQDSLTQLEITSVNLTGSQINSITINDPGQGYLFPPEIIIESKTGLGALLEAEIKFGEVINIKVLSSGLGYSIDDCVIAKGGTPIHTFAWAPLIGFNIIDKVEIHIGHRMIDTHTGLFLSLLAQTQITQEKIGGLRKMIGDVPKLTNYINNKDNLVMLERKLYSPLNFWYCKNPESSVPLVSLQYHPVDVYVTFNPVNKCIRRGATWFAKIDASNLTDIVEIGTKLYLDNIIAYLETDKLDNNSIDLYFNYQDLNTLSKFKKGDIINISNIRNITILDGPYKITEKVYKDPILTSSTLFVKYIQLDRIERTKFAQLPHEYLIHQIQEVQCEDIRGPNKILDIIKQNVVKEFIWVAILNENAQRNYWTNYTDKINHPYSNKGENMLIDAHLNVNDVSRIRKQKFGFFNYIQPYLHHTRIPPNGINAYSFAIYPEQGQPSGVMNFSILKDKKLTLNYDMSRIPTFAKLYLFFINYNVLRIKNGVGGIMFYN